MTPRQIAAALDADPIAGLTHGLGSGPEATPPEDGEDPYLVLCAARAEVCLYVNADDLGEVIAVARRAKVFRVTAETLHADLVEILAWSLCACQPDPSAPETRAALRSPGLYGEILRKFLEDQRPALAFFGDRYATLIAAIDAALETST
jgi:hypothetical protein